jgi:hypothetical protein
MSSHGAASLLVTSNVAAAVHCVPQIHHKHCDRRYSFGVPRSKAPRMPSQAPSPFSAHQAPAQSFPPMSNDPTLKPTESAYW